MAKKTYQVFTLYKNTLRHLSQQPNQLSILTETNLESDFQVSVSENINFKIQYIQ